MQIQITHVVPSSTPEKTQTFRVTVRQASWVDRSFMYELQREGLAYYTERIGVPYSEDTEDTEAIALQNLIFFRAEMLCVVDRERTAEGIVYLCDHKNGVSDAGWERKALPAEWVTPEGFADKMPTPFMDEWLKAVRQLNAGILGTIPDRFLPLHSTTSHVID